MVQQNKELRAELEAVGHERDELIEQVQKRDAWVEEHGKPELSSEYDWHFSQDSRDQGQGR